jgi:hypothetical protein
MNIDWNKLTNDVFKIIVVVAVISGVILFIYVGYNMSPGTIGYIAQYRMNQSKKNMRQIYLDFLSAHPSYNVPSEYPVHLEPYRLDPNDSVNSANPRNVDSVNFFFYVKDYQAIIWVNYTTLADRWNFANCTISLSGYIDLNSRWHYGKNMSEKEKKMFMNIFEEYILQRLPSVTYTRFED